MFCITPFKIIALQLLQLTNANFNVRCHGALVDAERVDPIINFGMVSRHAHNVWGGDAFSPTSSADDMLESGCSTCDVQADNSAYWNPTLYNVNPDGTYQQVRQIDMRAYYFTGNGGRSWPKGFETLFGNPSSRQEQIGRDGRSNIGYECRESPGPDVELPSFPSPNLICNKLQARLTAPECWDGVNLKSPNHDHVAYPNSAKQCPTSHPVKIIFTKFETHWDLSDIPFPRNLTWSMSDHTGYGFHVDFINGWDQDVFENAISTCGNSPEAADCPMLARLMHNIPQMNQCAANYQSLLTNGKIINQETCTGNIDTLCGQGNDYGVLFPIGITRNLPTSSTTSESTITSSTSSVPTPTSTPRNKCPNKPMSSSTARQILDLLHTLIRILNLNINA
jgi:hypothetical protein